MPLPTYPTHTTVGNLRIPHPARPLQEGVKTNSLIFAADSGHEQRRKKGENKRTWELTYTVLTQAQADTLWDFFLLHTNVTAFTWVHPVSKTTYTVRFSGESLQKDYFGHSPVRGPLYKMVIKLEEVL